MGTSDVREMDRSKSHVFIEPVLLQNSYFCVFSRTGQKVPLALSSSSVTILTFLKSPLSPKLINLSARSKPTVYKSLCLAIS
jgi:hypothetical protein